MLPCAYLSLFSTYIFSENHEFDLLLSLMKIAIHGDHSIKRKEKFVKNTNLKTTKFNTSATRWGTKINSLIYINNNITTLKRFYQDKFEKNNEFEDLLDLFEDKNFIKPNGEICD